MKLHTASEMISFSKELENESAKFYGDLARRYTKDAETFLSFVRDNKKNIAQIERAYYGVITDAIEGCFACDIEPDDYTFSIELAENVSYSAALDKALEIEAKIVKFYSDAAEQSESLMADVPRNFKLVAKKKIERIAMLQQLKGGRGIES